jgi:hypothetical protein
MSFYLKDKETTKIVKQKIKKKEALILPKAEMI